MEGQSILNSVCEGQSILNVPSAPLFGYETHASDFEVRVPLTAMSGSSACNVEEPPPSYESLRIDEKHTSGNSPKSRMTPMRLPHHNDQSSPSAPLVSASEDAETWA